MALSMKAKVNGMIFKAYLKVSYPIYIAHDFCACFCDLMWCLKESFKEALNEKKRNPYLDTEAYLNRNYDNLEYRFKKVNDERFHIRQLKRQGRSLRLLAWLMG